MDLAISTTGTQPNGTHLTGISLGNLVYPLEAILESDGSSHVLYQGVILQDFTIKEGDRLPVLRVQLKDANGTIPNLTGSTVTFNVRNLATGVIDISGSCTIEDATNAIVSYAWDSNDTTTVFEGVAEFRVVDSSSLGQTFPSAYHINIHCIDRAA